MANGSLCLDGLTPAARPASGSASAGRCFRLQVRHVFHTRHVGEHLGVDTQPGLQSGELLPEFGAADAVVERFLERQAVPSSQK